jgi:RNA polymerase sigma-70 factor (ECF subfamily)
MEGSAPDESSLVRSAQAGDQAAFRRLVARHKDRAYALALRLTGSAADAEEVAQDAFVRAWRALPAFRLEAAFGTWLHRIVSRLALDRRVQLVARARREAPESAAPEPVAPEAAGDENERRLARLLDDLGERARAAVVLYYYEDRSVSEVARILGVPEGTVKTLLSRARDALRESWSREEARQR